ncbi:MAG: DUF1015 domain-containing protein [Nanoarchaeota archaeon]
MVNIKAFKGILYNKEKIDDFSKVITPPYDVISKKEQEEFYNDSKYNFIRILLTTNGSLKYEQAAETFKEWQEEGILKQDKEDSIYVYKQAYGINGGRVERLGFISKLELEEWGKSLLPHELIMEGPMQDRLRLMETIKATVGTIFILYDDKEKIIDDIIKQKIGRLQPYMDFRDKKEVRHTLYKINDKEFIKVIVKKMAKHQCIMADGHHRYTTALEYKKIHPEMEKAKYSTACFVNSFNEGLLILPTNRLVFGLKNYKAEEFIEKLGEYFEVEKINSREKMINTVESTTIMIDKTKNLKNNVFGFYDNVNNESYILTLKKRNVLDNYLPDATDVYKKLDVKILHIIILEKILGITEEEIYKGDYVEFSKGNDDTVEKLKDDKYQLAFFINPPLMREVFLTARSGETMPQKSTCFYPKLCSGLVISKLG